MKLHTKLEIFDGRRKRFLRVFERVFERKMEVVRGFGREYGEKGERDHNLVICEVIPSLET